MKPKVCLTKEQQLDHWKQHYLQAKTSGNTKLMKMLADVIKKLGGTVPKL